MRAEIVSASSVRFLMTSGNCSPSAVMIFAAEPDYVIVNRSQLGKHEVACSQRRHIEVPAIDTLPEADGQVGGGLWRRDFQVAGIYRAAAGMRPA
jgi:hypothetical protein